MGSSPQPADDRDRPVSSPEVAPTWPTTRNCLIMTMVLTMAAPFVVHPAWGIAVLAACLLVSTILIRRSRKQHAAWFEARKAAANPAAPATDPVPDAKP